MKLPTLSIVLAVAALAAALPAQGCSLTTDVNGTSGLRGFMFDVSNITAGTVTILSFDQNFFGAAPAAAHVEIYTVTSGGPFAPVATTASAWTLVGLVSNLACSPQGTLTPLPVAVNVALPAGTTRGFYVTCTNSTTTQLVSTPVAAGNTGQIYVQDTALAVRVGIGKLYPFSVAYQGRVWNGRVNYATPVPAYQVNQPAAGFDLEGVLGQPCSPAIVTRCVNRTITASFSSTNIGFPFEAVIGFQPVVAAGGGAFATPGGQLVNVNIFTPTLLWLFGGALPSLLPFPGNFAATFNSGVATGTVTGQVVVVDPPHPDGFALSQASQLNIASTVQVAGPTGDDSSLLVVFSALPLCGPSSVPFFGASFTQLQVISNGRLMFGAASTVATPTLAAALADAPWVGAWADLNPSAGGSITITSPALNLVRVAWNAVPYYGYNNITTTWSITLDGTTGLVVLDGLLGWPLFPNSGTGANLELLGISAGSLGATDPGITTFGVGGPNIGPVGMGMLYQLGQGGTLATGVNTLTFLPNPNPNYDWLAQ